MAQIVKEIKLEVSKPNFIQAIVAKQNDCNSRFLKVSLWDEGVQLPIPPASSVTINAERSDGEAKRFWGVVNDDNTATVPLHSWILEVDGEVICDVSILGEEERKLTSTNFVVMVEKAACGSESISTDPEYDVLLEMIEEVNEVKKIKASQGRSAKYNFTTPGWKRILNIIRASSGAVDIGLCQGEPYRMVQTLAFDVSGFVKYLKDSSSTAKPVLLKRYENVFGNDDATGQYPCKITKVRLAYPKKGTSYPDTDHIVGPANPVNCYLDIYVDFKAEDGTKAFNLNYAGFSDSHNCEEITEETPASDTGIYGEALDFYTVDVESMPYILTDANVHVAPETSTSWGAYGVTLATDGRLRTAYASNADIDGGWNKYKIICPSNLRYAVTKTMIKTLESDGEDILTNGDFIGQMGILSDIDGLKKIYIYTGTDEETENPWWQRLA